MRLSDASPGSSSEGHHDLDLERVVAVSGSGGDQELPLSLVDHDRQPGQRVAQWPKAVREPSPVSRQSSPKF